MHSLNTLQSELTSMYAAYERELNAWIASYPRGVSCHKGCRTCCNMSVGLYLPEAIVLAKTLTDAQYRPVAEYAHRVVAYAETTDNYLDDFRHAGMGWCPFLDDADGACGIHPSRPANCRHVFSNLPPKYCDKDAECMLTHDAEQYDTFLRQLDPDVNKDGLPYIEALNAIFHECYEFYLIMLTARHYNVIVQAEMSWLLLLAREHDLERIVTQPGGTPEDFIRYVRGTGLYHEKLLTTCREIPTRMQEAVADIDFMRLP